VLFVIGDVGVELAEVLVLEGIGLEFYEDVALEDTVIEDEVDEEVFVADENALLPGLETEPVAQLEEEILKAVEQGVFEVGLGHDIPRPESEELEDVGIADDVGGLERFRRLMRQGGELGLVFGKATALVVEAGDLATQLADGPVPPDTLDLVKAPLGVVGKLNEFGEMGEGEAVEQFGMVRQRRWSH
jgi:hypothetical protein